MRTLVTCRDCLSPLMSGEKHSDEACLSALSELINQRADYTAELIIKSEALIARIQSRSARSLRAGYSDEEIAERAAQGLGGGAPYQGERS